MVWLNGRIQDDDLVLTQLPDRASVSRMSGDEEDKNHGEGKGSQVVVAQTARPGTTTTSMTRTSRDRPRRHGSEVAT